MTRILESIQHGDPKAADELLPLVYAELRKLAAYKMAQNAAGHTLQPTALVHEVWMRLVGSENPTFESRAHFFAAADEDHLLALNEALDRLAARSPVEAQVVKLRFFVGMTVGESAEVLGLSERTVKQYWSHAKTWLYQEIQSNKT